MDGASTAAFKEMLEVVKLVLDIKLNCLKMQPKDDSKEWNFFLIATVIGPVMLKPE
jgi:hypothetical protein